MSYIKCILNTTVGVIFSMAAVFTGLPSQANAWTPSSPIVLVTHATPGAGIDLYLRELASIWEKHKFVDVKVSVQNRTGGRGEKARRYVAEQNAGNPHVLFSLSPSNIANAVMMNSDITAKNFTPIAMMGVEPLAMIVHADSPFHSAHDVLEAARNAPGKIIQGGGAFGTISSLVSILMSREANVEITYTPFQSGGDTTVALLGKHIDFTLESPAQVNTQVKAGHLRIIAASIPLAEYPDVKTFKQQDLNFRTLESYRGLLGAPDLPEGAVEFYTELMEKTKQTPEWINYISKNDLANVYYSGDQLRDILFEEEKIYIELGKEVGLSK